MAVEQRSPEDTLAEISAIAAQGSPEFMVKIGKRSGLASFSSHVATMSGASVEHISQPEGWISRLLGGGEFTLSVFSAKDLSKRIGGILAVSIDPNGVKVRNTIDFSAMERPNWDGPRVLNHPERPSPRHSGAVANGEQVPAGTGTVVYDMSGGMPRPPATIPPEIAAQLQAAERRAIQAESDLKAAAEASRIRAEAEARQRESDNRLNALMAQITALQNKPVEAPKPALSIPELIAAATPLVSLFVSSQQEARNAAQRASEEAQRRAEAAAERQQQQFTAMMERLNNKPQMDESTKMLLETLKANQSGGGAYADMMTRMVDAMGTVSKTSVSMIQTIAELQMGDAPSPVVEAVKEGVKALALLSKGNEESARKVIRQSQGQQQPQAIQQLTPQQVAQIRAQQQAQQQQHAAQMQAQQVAHQRAMAEQQAQHAGVAPAHPTKGTAQQTQPAAVAPVAAPVAAPVEVVTFEALPVATPHAPEMVAATTPTDQLEALIRAEHDVDEVASLVVQLISANEASFHTLLEAHDMDPEAALLSRLGDWAPMHISYLERFAEAVSVKGEEAGVFDPEEGEAPQGEEDAEMVPA